MKKLMLATAALGALTIAGPVLAADLPARMPYKAPPPPIPYFSWTGCYIGGHIGGAWGHRSFDNGRFTTAAGTTFFQNNGFDNSGWLGGGQAGCQWQITNVVFGIEGDGSWTSLSGSVTDPFFLTNFNAKTDVIYDVTGRLGWAWDRWLIYAKGGGAWAQDSFTVVDPLFGSVSDSFTRSGWVIGGGVEWAFWDNWSMKLEYLHYDFGSRNFNGVFPVAAPVGFNFDAQTRVDTIKFGINWRFYPWAPPPAPVVARY
jgi:outer membrane immunogenic protein